MKLRNNQLVKLLNSGDDFMNVAIHAVRTNIPPPVRKRLIVHKSVFIFAVLPLFILSYLFKYLTGIIVSNI